MRRLRIESKISCMGEMGGREHRSVATAERRCLGLRVGGCDGLGGWESTVRERDTAGSGGIFVLGNSHRWCES